MTLELKKQDLKRIEGELEKVQACILKISEAYPERVEALKVRKGMKMACLAYNAHVWWI